MRLAALALLLLVQAGAWSWSFGEQPNPTCAPTSSISAEVDAPRLERPAARQRPERGRFALIINGDSSPHHVQNCQDAYAALRANGFSDEDIFMLSSEPTVGADNVPTLGRNDGPPSHHNLRTVFRHLKEEVRSGDLLVVYVTGHGGFNDGDSEPECFVELVPRVRDVPNAHGPQLSVSELGQSLAEIRPGRGLLVFDQCYGQAFASTLGKGVFAAIALSTQADEVFCQNFSPVFWKELRRSGAARRKISNSSVKAAFGKAARHSRRKDRTHRPLLKSGIDSSKFFLFE